MHRRCSAKRHSMRMRLLCGVACLLLLPAVPRPALAQAAPQAAQVVETFNPEQLDALLAPIALYPDTLLAQVLMASAYPLQIVQAARWLDAPANKALAGDALATALEAQSWDPSVKSLVPFPQVLMMMNDKLEWTEQLGYAAATQQADVLGSVQRLRRQAQATGNLASTAQQVVRTEAPGGGPATQVPGAVQTIVIQPASPQVVYVPTYNPAVVYGAWPYPAYSPVVLPPPGYVAGTALAAGLAFGAGVAITASLWNVGYPNWNGGHMNVNVNRYNSINVNRAQVNSANWRPANGTAAGVGRPVRPPAGPVGRPARTNGLPANAIGRPTVPVPASLVNRQARSGGTAPAAGGAGGRAAGVGQASGASNRPTPAQRPTASLGGGRVASGAGPLSGGAGQAAANRPGAGNGAARRPAPTTRPAGAFGGIGDGRQAGQFSARGSQSRQLHQAGGAARQPGAAGRGGGRAGRRG